MVVFFGHTVRYHVTLKMKEEVNQKKVARDFNMSRCIVWKIWLKFLKTGTVSDIRKPDRPCLLSERGYIDLVIPVKKSYFCGLLQLLEVVQCATQVCLEAHFSNICGSLGFVEERLQEIYGLRRNTRKGDLHGSWHTSIK